MVSVRVDPPRRTLEIDLVSRGRNLESRMQSAPEQGEALAWLLACLDNAARALRWGGCDVDARVIEAHRAQLARGSEWPGDVIWSASDHTFPEDRVRLASSAMSRRGAA